MISFHCSEIISYHFTVELSNQIGTNNLVGPIGLHVRVNIPNFKVTLDLESLKCYDYDCFLIKQKLEKPSKWVKLKKEFSFDDKQVSEAFLLPVRVANEPYPATFLSVQSVKFCSVY